MPLGELTQDESLRAVQAMAALPPAPPPREERSAWGIPWRIVKAATAGLAGSVADVVKGYGAAGAITAEADPTIRAAVGDEAVRAGAAEGRRQFDTGEALTSEVGRSFRAVQHEARPDPATASTAERLVFGVGEPLLKLAGGGIALGPIGIGLAATEQGFQQSEELRAAGVDPATRTAVGTLTAAATAGSAFLPLAGPTVRATAGLYLTGGPGAFVAQQAATRAILEHADYPAVAEQFNPFDPVGLAASFAIPLPFAAHGVAKIVAGRAPAAAAVPRASPELVDAAMTHNLSLQADARPKVQEVAQRIAEHYDANPPKRLHGAQSVEPPADQQQQPPKPAGEGEQGGAAAAIDAANQPPAPTAAAPASADPLVQSVASRVQALAAEQPHVAQTLERITKEVAEGTDTELGTLDADLIRVAAECALATGTA